MKVNHGANLFDLSKKLGIAVEDLKDFSSNVNPLGPSPKAMDKLKDNLDKVSVYPDPNYDDLLESLEKYTSISRENILLGSGTTNLISAYIGLCNPENAIIFNPSYSEYQRELKKIGSNIISYDLKAYDDFKVDIDKLLAMIEENKVGLVIITNPNNPTGYAIDKKDIEKLISSTECKFMIDETYIEFTDIDKYSSISLALKYDNLLVLRSTSKFFSTCGIRLGYGITSGETTIKALEKSQNLWNINIFAEIMGTEMFIDTDYQKKTYDFIKAQKDYMISELSKIEGLKVYPSESNFVLNQLVSKKMTAHELREKLMEDALIIRDCESFINLDKYFFRFCILDDKSNQKLLDKISEYLG